ncbi:MAG TPA: GTPase [Gemmataceae bacterium]|nr:GTPase [Gemmataceae bacterium]
MDTQIACLTAPGKAAIATLAVRGPLAWSITRELFKPIKGALPADAAPGRCSLGKLGTQQADDAILAVKSDCIELHCHGGIEVVRMVQELYRARGAISVPWQAFLPEPTDVLDMLAHAPTTRTAGILLDQANGAWERCIDAMDSTRLAELVPLGRHLVEPWRIVIAGAPNVGKSSLMNALAGYTRSIIAPTPGTTRDLVSVRLAIDGWPIEVTDTAGIRAAPGELEQQGIARAHAAARDADLRFWVLDGSSEPVFPDERSGWHMLINKIDLPATWDWQSVPEALRVSARTRDGVADWCAWISRLLVPAPPAAGEAVPCTAAHFAWIEANRG